MQIKSNTKRHTTKHFLKIYMYKEKTLVTNVTKYTVVVF